MLHYSVREIEVGHDRHSTRCSPQPGAAYTYVTTKAISVALRFRYAPRPARYGDTGLLSKKKLLAGALPGVSATSRIQLI
jgi:hypothetical protein